MATNHQRRDIGAPAPADVREPIALLVQTQGVRETADLTGLSRAQVTAIASGARIISGTLAQAREGLRRARGEAA